MPHRTPGTPARCRCSICGEYEIRGGGNANFKCSKCEPFVPAKYLAHKAVADAIKAGKLERPAKFKCVDCGKPARHYEHRDYFKPLDVHPVCISCNYRRGPALNHVQVPKPAYIAS